MMIGKKNPFSRYAKLRLEGAGDPEFIQHPADHRLSKNLPGLRISLKNTGENAVELAKRFFKKDGIVEVAYLYARLLYTKPHGIRGKGEIVFDARKTFFFGRSEEFAIAQDCRGGIMVVAGDSQNVHELLFLCPANIVGFRGPINPSCGTFLDLK